MARFLDLEDLFKGRYFDHEVIILCVRWYLRFKLSGDVPLSVEIGRAGGIR